MCSSAGKIWENIQGGTGTKKREGERERGRGVLFSPISAELCSSQDLVTHPHKHASTEIEERTACELLMVGQKMITYNKASSTRTKLRETLILTHNFTTQGICHCIPLIRKCIYTSSSTHIIH
jgi:hypothetical protein